MSINQASGVAPFRQVAAALRDQISQGKYVAGGRIPSARDIATEFEVSPVTAQRALDELRADGLIETRRGTGSFVRQVRELFRKGANRYQRNSEGLAPNRAESSAGGWTDEVTAELWRQPAGSELAARLNVDPEEEVTAVRYLWTVEKEPVQVSTQYEPLRVTGGTSIEEPVDGTRGNPGVISRFDSIGVHIDRVEEETRVRMPNAEESEQLQIGAGVPVFAIKRTHWAADVAVETADIIIRGDRMVITATHDVPMNAE
ncbi:GntR family transcriptional regulator [Lentzea cavernae]|uniref:GntR family transcriptional regulator n=1 Tax=Lentzea cavernae TaxID=2020703 RepID=A0ABQ3MSL6_9PSEU|nr:GntR family transcriptional regulator [Lentzea cavernae]GHH59784.1 GntR family transcriptional regulator [Lentzea cavernae]